MKFRQKSLEVTKSFGGRFRQWWTIDNWTKAADLAFKFTAILVALAALNFFALKPEVSWSVASRTLIDVDSAQSYYESQSPIIPSGVREAILRSNQLGIPVATHNDGGVIVELTIFSPGTMLFPEVFLAPPDFVFLEEHGEFSLEERLFALDAIAASRYTLAEVTISNKGQVTARSVKVTPPPGYILEGPVESFDLPGGSSQRVRYKTEVGAPAEVPASDADYSDISLFARELGGFNVTWETTDVANPTFLAWMGSFFLAVWLFTVLKAIWDTSPLK